ncbi:MAG TPA: type II restriction endonuclease, partial [Acidimicrobiia bacterium]|nr:type II restriction endonuclease [Acidimicrobiia bacterium]
NLQRKLEAILNGEKPFDIYIRWKQLHEQPVGWEPELNDGVRLNIRPFVKVGVLRSPLNIHWRKDRGKNPDASERHNDVHLSLAEKVAARKRVIGS